MKKENSICIACKKEMEQILKKEAAMQRRASKDVPDMMARLRTLVPDKVINGFETAFAKSFEIVFLKGTLLIDKTYNKAELMNGYRVRDYAVRLTCSQNELKCMRKAASRSNSINSIITTIEGTALGAIGVGISDIAIFLSLLLKAIHESATQYGYVYDTPKEKLLILKMIEASLSRSESRETLNAEVDRLLLSDVAPSDDEIKKQISRTSRMLAVDMLVMKFLQGIPIVGIVGGLSNSVYFNKIMKYVQLKYHKRYIRNLMAESEGRVESENSCGCDKEHR